MKSRGVDIFRPLAAASSAASIFRRGNNNQGGGMSNNNNNNNNNNNDIAVDYDRGPVVVDVVDACDSDGGMEEGHYYRHIIGRSAPLVSCASSGGENGTASCSSSRPPAKAHREPSYYKMRLVSREDGRERMNANDDGGGPMIEVQLTAGDDSSVQLTPLRNRRLRIAHDDNADEADYDDESDHAFVARLAAERHSRGGISLAAPVASEAFEIKQESDVACDAVVVDASPPPSFPRASAVGGDEGGRRRRQRRQRWTVTDDGTIVALPPSPSHVSSLAAASTADAAASSHEYPSHLLLDEGAHRTREAEPSSHVTCPSSSSPPELVRSVSSCSSTSSSTSSPPSAGRRTKTPSPPPPVTLASVSLESPPRMTRSFHPASLFRDTDSDRTSSYGSGSDDRSRSSRGSKRKKTRRTTTERPSSRVADAAGDIPPSLPGTARSASPSPSCGGGSRFSFLSHLLDVYVLSGLGCCRHTDDDGDVRPMSGGICA